MGQSLATQLTTLFIDMNSYFASVEQQINPALRQKPVIVVPTDTDATCAIAASYEAKALGIKTNTPVWEAKALCPALKIVVARHDVYVDFHEKIMTEIDKYAPLIKIHSIDEVACEIPHHYREPELAKALGQQIKIGIWHNVGEAINCSIGIAPNQLLGKIASDMQKPNGLTVLLPENLPHAIYDLKLRDFPGIGKGMERRLHLKGIFNIKQFCHLSPKQARKIWGSVSGERYWYQLHGMEITLPKSKKTTVGHSHVLAPALRSPEKARLVARRLLAKAASRLRRFDYYAGQVYLSVRFEEFQRWSDTVSIHHAQDTFSLSCVLNMFWEAMEKQHGKKKRIKKISVGFLSLRRKDKITRDFFSMPEHQTEKWEKASQTLDVINQKYGRDTIFMGALPGMKNTKTQKGRLKMSTSGMGQYSGTKIAFSRIPDKEEFFE